VPFRLLNGTEARWVVGARWHGCSPRCGGAAWRRALVRLPLAWWAAKGLDKELTWLPQLAPLLPSAIPVVLGKGVPAEGYPLPWALYRWLDGENPTVDRLAEP
jgi:aminoglycoside phosphotransferase (APT) family kinase protein